MPPPESEFGEFFLAPLESRGAPHVSLGEPPPNFCQASPPTLFLNHLTSILDCSAFESTKSSGSFHDFEPDLQPDFFLSYSPTVPSLL